MAIPVFERSPGLLSGTGSNNENVLFSLSIPHGGHWARVGGDRLKSVQGD